MKKLCVISTTRADYGLLRNLLGLIEQSSILELQLVVAGAHLLDDFGNTISEIQQDGFTVRFRVEGIGVKDNREHQITSASKALKGFGEAYRELNPDAVVLLGDRYEMLSAAFAALLLNIPIFHIHGGEITTGAIDDAIRHCLTKLSSQHFVANEEFRTRCIQMGENPETVHIVGGLGVDAIAKTNFKTKDTLEKELDFKINSETILVCFHPETHESSETKAMVFPLIQVLQKRRSLRVIFSQPNIDLGNSQITKSKQQFVAKNRDRSTFFKSMGSENYLSLLKVVTGVVGNSSSGILEAPTLNTGTINIGNRQQGRPRASSVIDTRNNNVDIDNAFKKLFASDFQQNLRSVQSPYGPPGAADKIIRIIEIKIHGLHSPKIFHDLRLSTNDIGVMDEY